MKAKFSRAVFCGGLLLLLSAAPAGAAVGDSDLRPAGWAQALVMGGVPNFHRVDAGLFRGGQPTATGFEELQKLGIRTIVNLRSFHSDTGLLRGAPLSYEEIPVQAWYPEEEDVIRFLKIAADPARRPVFLHCHYGADRTGLMVAVYRVVVSGWTKEEALREMIWGGYGFHATWANLVRFFRKLDFPALRKEAGVEEGNPPAGRIPHEMEEAGIRPSHPAGTPPRVFPATARRLRSSRDFGEP